MQHQFLRALALRAQEAGQAHFATQRPARNQPGVRLEGDGAELGVHLALAAGFVLLGFMRELEFERGEACGRLAQCAPLKQPAAQLEAVQCQYPGRAPSSTSTSPLSSSERAW